MLAICDVCNHRHFRVHRTGGTVCANEVCIGTDCGPGGAATLGPATTGVYAPGWPPEPDSETP